MLTATPPANEPARLLRLQQLCLLDTGAEQVLDDFTRLAATVTGMPIALISLLDVDRQWFKSAVGLPQGSQTPRDWAFCAHVIADGAPAMFEVPDASRDPRFSDNPLATGAPHVQHYAGVPLTLPGGEKIGTLCVIDHHPGQLSQAQWTVLLGLGQTLVNVLLLREEDLNHRRRLELTLDAADAGCWEYLPQRGMLKPSPAFIARFLPSARVPEFPLGHLAQMSPPAAVQRFSAALLEALATPEGRFTLVHEARDPHTGQPIWLRTQGRVIERDAAGLATRMVGVTRDVTTSHEQRLALQRERDRADAATRAKSDFLASMSHEIRTPIHGVLGLTRMLQGRDLPAQEAGWVRSIGQCGSTLLQLVDDILDFSKIEAGQMTLHPADVDLHALLDELRAMFDVRAREKGLRFAAALEHDVPAVVRADPLRLRQILINLLGNAVKFTDRGGFTLDVHRAGERLVFEVSDSGVGIADHEQSAVFGRYRQSAPMPLDDGHAPRAKGTGLGLAIVKDLARLMGGEIRITSVVGQGSTFALDLPLERGQTQAPRTETATPRLDGLRVLAVDDDEINRMVAEGLLRVLGVHDITLASDGRSALELCARRDFDIILMDCQMPGLHGTEVTRQLRASGWRGPILALSAGSTPQEKAACLAAGMDTYLTKPLALQTLAQALSTFAQPALARHAAAA